MKTKSEHLHSETSGVFSNAISHSLINYFRLTYSRGSFTVIMTLDDITIKTKKHMLSQF